MLGLDNPIHIAFILVLLLLVFGAKRLPEMGKSMGAGLRGFKESISGEEPTTRHTEASLPESHAHVRIDDLTVMRSATAEPAREPVSERTAVRPAA